MFSDFLTEGEVNIPFFPIGSDVKILMTDMHQKDWKHLFLTSWDFLGRAEKTQVGLLCFSKEGVALAFIVVRSRLA